MGRILITGGAGFLGSHLTDALIAKGNEVIVVDNFVSGSKDNIKHLEGNPNFTLIEHDVSEPLAISHIVVKQLMCFLSIQVCFRQK